MTQTDARWDGRQRALALALLEYEDGCCPGGCGGHLDETTAPDAEFAYSATDPVRCHKCATLARAKKGWEQESDEALAGVLFSAVKGPPQLK